MTEDDVAAVVSALRSDWLTTGPLVERFEHALAERLGASHVVVVSSGTAALHAALQAARVGPGDEVILPPLTFVATANAVAYQGATPVFADIDPGTLMLDPRAARSAVTARTRAIVTVHFSGAASGLPALRDIARGSSCNLIEDAAHALGATGDDGHVVGSRSTLATFSFHPVKHVATGEGGAIATTDPERAQLMRSFRNHGIDRDVAERQRGGEWHYRVTMLGFNYRLPDIACALGLSQLRRLSSNLARRREIAKRLRRGLADVDAVCVPAWDADASAWHLFPVLVRSDVLSISRDDLIRALRAEGIGATLHYPLVHLHPFYRERFGHREGEFPVAEDVAARILTLPLFPSMTNEDADQVVQAVRRVTAWFAR